MPLFWNVHIDLNNNNSWDVSENFGTLLRDIKIKRGREFFLGEDGKGFEPVSPGECTVVLDNQDRRFDPNNTGSPIYPNFKPGKKIRVQCRIGLFDTYTIFTGRISEINPSGGSDLVVEIKCLDNLQWLKDRQDIQITLIDDDTVRNAFYYGLIWSGWSTVSLGNLLLDDNRDLIPFFWINQDNAYDVFMSLAEAYMGRAFVDKNNAFVYYSRNHAYTVMGTFGESDLLKEIPTTLPWDIIRNDIVLTAYPRTAAIDLEDIFKIDDPILIMGGQTIYLDFEYADGNPCNGLVSMDEGVDYKMNTLPDGTGDDRSMMMNVGATYYANRGHYSIKNNDPTENWVTLFKQRGKPIRNSDPVEIRASDAASQNLYTRKTLALDNEFIQNVNFGISYASFVLGSLKDPTIYPTIMIETDNPVTILNMELFDRWTLDLPTLGISGDYLISSIEIELAEGSLNALLITLTLELPLIGDNNYWTFSTNIGTTSYFAF